MTDAEQRALRDRSEARDPCSLEILVLALWQSLGVRNGDFDREPLFGTQAHDALADVFLLVKGNIDVDESRDERVDVIEGESLAGRRRINLHGVWATQGFVWWLFLLTGS